jgi:hypothetical protein
MKLDNTLEMVVGDLIEEKLRDARLKRLLRTKILIIDDKDGEPALYTYKGKPTDQNLGSMRAAILGKKITGRLVNGGDEALLAEARALV